MNVEWLAAEAKHIHATFAGLFHSMVALLLVVGVILNFFKMPVGQVPEFVTLVGRAIVASLILAALPEIMNALSNVTDDLARELGSLNNFKLVVSRLGEKIRALSWSWVSVKDSVLMLVSYVSFFLLYVSVYVSDAVFVLVWTLLYIFSPVLIAAFTLPSTASAAKGLFRAMIEVCAWKVAWSVLAALLWSYALSEVNKPEYGVDFLTAIILNLLLAFSVVTTPFVVRAIFGGSMHTYAASASGAIAGAAMLTPSGIVAGASGAAGAPLVAARELIRRRRETDRPPNVAH